MTMECHSIWMPVNACSIAELVWKSSCRWIIVILVCSLFADCLAGCGTIPNAEQVIHTRMLQFVHPRFIGPHGSLTRAQGEQIIARIQAHQEQPTDILERHLGFEQAISN